MLAGAVVLTLGGPALSRGFPPSGGWPGWGVFFETVNRIWRTGVCRGPSGWRAGALSEVCVSWLRHRLSAGADRGGIWRARVRALARLGPACGRCWVVFE